MKAGGFCLIMRKQESTDRLWFRQVVLRCTALHRLDRPAVKEHTAAVSRKGWETDDFEFCVDFRTVVGDLQSFAIERRVLIDPQPFGVHVGKDAAEGVVDQLLQWQLFQLRQRLVAIAENPVHCRMSLAEYHFNVRKGDGHMVKAGVVTVVRLPRGGGIIALQCLTDFLPFDAQLLHDLPACGGVRNPVILR